MLSAREMLRPWTLPNEGTGEFCNTLLPFYIFGPGNQNIHFGDAAPFFFAWAAGIPVGRFVFEFLILPCIHL